MGHVNAGLEFLISIFNDMWPLVLATFVGAWIAFKHHKHQESREQSESQVKALKHALFVISSQLEQLQQIYQLHFEPKTSNARRAYIIDPVMIHSDFPGLEMKTLPMVFGDKDFHLMNRVADAEQSFSDIVSLLKQRASRLSALEVLDIANPEGRKRQISLEKSLEKITNRLYEEFPIILEKNSVVLGELKGYAEQREQTNSTYIIDYSSWYFLASACAIAGVFFFSHWAINARSLLDSGLDITLVSAVVFAVSLYASLAMGIVVAVLSLFSLVKKLKSFSVYFWTFLISLQPTIFLLWLDVS